jgi:hypothetical protein
MDFVKTLAEFYRDLAEKCSVLRLLCGTELYQFLEIAVTNVGCISEGACFPY